MITYPVVVVALCLSVAAQAQTGDTLRLPILQRAAEQLDPRARELSLLTAQARLRRLNIDAERRPLLAVESQAQYQSDVAHLPITLPGGAAMPTPAHDTYDAHISAQQRLYDPTVAPRRALEDARLDESRARLQTSLYAVRQGVNDLFFAALRAQIQADEVQTTISDLDAQLRAANARVRQGTALPSEGMAIQAELLHRRQMVGELRSTRRSALEVLADLTGARIDTGVVLALPIHDVRLLQDSTLAPRLRPEFAQFAATRATLEQQEAVRSAQDKPRVSAFTRVGYGRPGLNPLSDNFTDYWLAGVQLQWSPWTWGTSDRDRETLALQRQIVSADEQAFADNLRRSRTQDLATITRIEQTLAMDEQIISLRERIAAETRIRFLEGVVMAPEYVDRDTDVLRARIARAGHRVELEQGIARLLTTMGMEVR